MSPWRGLSWKPEMARKPLYNDEADVFAQAQKQSEPTEWDILVREASKASSEIIPDWLKKEIQAAEQKESSSAVLFPPKPPSTSKHNPIPMMYCKKCRNVTSNHKMSMLGDPQCVVCHEPLLEYTVETLANLLFDQMKLLDEDKRISEESRRIRQELNTAKELHRIHTNSQDAKITELNEKIKSLTEEIQELKRKHRASERSRREIHE